MEARLTSVNRRETLYYLAWKGSEIPPELQRDLDRCETLLKETIRPRVVWRLFPLKEDGSLEGTFFRPQGDSVRSLLASCHAVILMAATLGSESERLLRQAQARNMADAVILDATADAAIENVCDNLCEDLTSAMAPAFLTDRFSPGYGDFPLSQQTDLCRVLDLNRRIGVSLSPGGLLLPQKSVTALIGVAATPQPKRKRGCPNCSHFDHCSFRKEGKSCEN